MRKTPRIVALVLAAGYSSRMWTFKPLAPLGTSTLIEEAVTRFIKAGIADVRVVVGHRADEVTPVLDRLGVRWILNAHYDRGMFSSILTGVKSFEDDVDGFFLLPGDIATVNPETIRALLNACDPDDPKIVYPRFGGQRGHPPLIPAVYLRQDLSPDYPGGLRAVLGRYEHNAMDVDVMDESILMDCDTPSDYLALVQRRSMEGVPTEAECAAIWSRFKVSREVIAHSILVAEVAGMLAVHLNGAGLALSLPLILAAGRLHDIAKGEPDHAGAGARLLAERGYPLVGAVVAKHMDIRSLGPSLDEADLIYFADKCVEEDRLVPLEERFEKSLGRYAGRADVREKILERFENAKKIGKRIEAFIGRPLEEVIGGRERSMRTASTGSRRVIYLVRHGAIQSPADPRRFIGQVDLPLNAEGFRQAEQLAEALEDVPLSAVFCSDLKRAVDTAQIIAKPHQFSCIPRRDLREISLGLWEGLTFDEVRSQHPEEFRARGFDIVHYRPPQGESFLDCALRFIPAFYEILNSTRGNILIVGHAGVNRIILSQALCRSLEGLFGIDQEYGCLNILVHRYPTLEVMVSNGSPSDMKRFQAELRES
jgi:broad specificity phosphatase PhoE/CTP:molybdopterin cytidylyltransferase MocA